MSKQNISVSLPILPILTIVFLVLKLTGNIDWSWFWVLSPTLIPLCVFACGLAMIGLGVAVSFIYSLVKRA